MSLASLKRNQLCWAQNCQVRPSINRARHKHELRRQIRRITYSKKRQVSFYPFPFADSESHYRIQTVPCFSLLDCHKVLFMRGILPLQGAFRQVILTQRYWEKRIPNLWAGMWALALDMHEAMRDKYLKGVFGTCPRVLCDSTGLRWILDGEQFLRSRSLSLVAIDVSLWREEVSHCVFEFLLKLSRNFCDMFLTFMVKLPHSNGIPQQDLVSLHQFRSKHHLMLEGLMLFKCLCTVMFM